MNYISTRDISGAPAAFSSAEAIKTGLAPDGGLFMPESIPTLADGELDILSKMSYPERATAILSKFLTDYDKDTLLTDCKEAYSDARFPGGAAQLKKVKNGTYSLELWHGPTCAFKDMALQIMPRLLSRVLTMTGEKKRARILVATSGDTGKAALEGYRDVDGIDIIVFYPVDGVSAMQKMQMTTQQGDNVRVCAVTGNFDDAQSGVKAIFADASLAEKADANGFFFSSANSINWGRLAPQIVYYISAYCDLVTTGAIKSGDKINICVPTGNFGNIFAAYIAKKMGLPVARFICASNSNCVLTDFLSTGKYDRTRKFYKTMSPSMDILISSNLERLLFLIGGAAATADYMKKLSSDGCYTADGAVMTAIKNDISGYFCTEAETAEVIKKSFDENGYLMDPHTAVGFGAVGKYRAETGDNTVTVLASTASPYKFGADVCAALGNATESDNPAEIIGCLEKISGTKSPEPLRKTLTLPRCFDRTVKPQDMASYIFEE